MNQHPTYTSGAASGRSVSRQAGWNLIELLVVISIITILLAILINSAAEGKGPDQLTKVTMRAAMGAATEYEASTSQIIDPLTSTPAGAQTGIGRLCYRLWQLDRTRNILYSLGKDVLEGGSSGPPAVAPTGIKDGWGKPMRYFGGTGGDVIIENGTKVKLGDAGMPGAKSPYLASAGPDGEWGSYTELEKKRLNQGFNATTANQAEDNLFSYTLD